MGKIIGTCQHELTLDWFNSEKGAICIKDIDREGKDCKAYLVVCPQCLEWYQKENLIIKEK